ncbi:MAG: hypothetical protein QOK30_398 [Nocardioidaceae bacterium]|jgi:hypothetical protein|nr:hypothetical protein [Nocardioidaceae bacterium]
MCTYTTEHREARGSGKGPDGWFRLETATVYYDHPVHAMAEHTLNIDLAAPSRGPRARVAVELTAESALELADAIVSALSLVPPELTGLSADRLASARPVAPTSPAVDPTRLAVG